MRDGHASRHASRGQQQRHQAEEERHNEIVGGEAARRRAVTQWRLAEAEPSVAGARLRHAHEGDGHVEVEAGRTRPYRVLLACNTQHR